MNRLLAFFFVLTISLPSVAQQDREAQKQINAIKRNNSYLYAEATMSSEAEAYDGAKNILRVTLEDWLTNKKKGKDISVYIAKAQNCLQQINTRRGNYYRQFLYVKKSDIMPVAENEDVMIVRSEGTATQQNSDMDNSNCIVKTESKESELPSSTVEEVVFQLTELEKRMVGIEQAEAIEPFVKSLQADGKLSSYGRYKDMPREAECYVFVYNRNRYVVAVIHQTSAGQVNLRTGNNDNVDNYASCGAIWFQTKQ